MYSFCVGFEASQCMVQCIVCARFAAQTIHFTTYRESERCSVNVGFVYSLHSFLPLKYGIYYIVSVR